MHECFSKHLRRGTVKNEIRQKERQEEMREHEQDFLLFKLKTFDITMSTYIS